MKKSLIVAMISAAFSFANAAQTGSATLNQQDVLVKFKTSAAFNTFKRTYSKSSKIEDLGVGNWVRVKSLPNTLSLRDLSKSPNVEYVQPNYKIYSYVSPSLRAARVKAQAMVKRNPHAFDLMAGDMQQRADNPEIPLSIQSTSGADPLAAKQWGMKDIGVEAGWAQGAKGRDTIVAVIDTGVDYTHEDLVENMWHNPGEVGLDAAGKEKATNGKDDDGNGYVDDVVGYDMVMNDNKPFDLAGTLIDILLKGENPGHGTHCAGNVGARGNNSLGIYGVAPETKIMALRFIGTKGEGTTADAVKAIAYAVKMGAKVLSNSWGSIGEDPQDAAGNKALRDAIDMTEKEGVLFIAAAGNGDPQTGAGYSNDADPAKASIPATLENENIISVAAMDSANALGTFSNWGPKSVDLCAPGVAIFSTVVQSEKYTDTIIDMMGIHATWDGTSMATPHVAGAAALYWSKHPTATWREVKSALMSSAVKTPSLAGKVVSGGRLNVEALMK